MVFAIQSLKRSLVINMAMLLTSLSLLSPSVAALANYTQVGSDINGAAAYEQFGTSVSMSDDGTSFVAGTPNADSYRGVVRVFKKDTNVSGMISYIQVGLDIVGKVSKDFFGSSVSMSSDGTSFVVGARSSYSGYGSVSVYNYNTTNGNYSQVGLDIVGKEYGGWFGASVSMSGDGSSFVAGATSSYNRNGSVSVYKYNTTTKGCDQVGLDIVGKVNGDLFGWSVSMSGDGTSFVAGALIGSSSNGSVSVFKYNTTVNSYDQVGPDIVGKVRSDQFGTSVSMSGDGTSFVVGAQHSNDNKGSVSVYQYKNDTSNFIQIGVDIVGKARNDLFGTSVSMSSNGASFAVGAKNNFDYGCFCYTSPGYVLLYKKNSINSTGSFDQVGSDIAGVNTGDQFGASVSVSGNGATVVVGAPRNGNVKGVESGRVRLYGDTASTKTPTTTPTNVPTAAPTKSPTAAPTSVPTAAPTKAPTTTPTNVPTAAPTKSPTAAPTSVPTAAPTKAPTASPTKAPRAVPTKAPTSKAPVFVISPTETPIASNEKCGFFGLNLLCLQRGKCGFVKRLLNLGNCS